MLTYGKVALVSTLGLTFCGVTWGQTPAAGSPAKPSTHAQRVEFIKTYCADCHNPDKMKGDFDISPLLKTQSVKENISTWEDVSRRIANQDMPPLDSKTAKRPTDALFQSTAGALEMEIAQATGNSGRLARRLNRVQYNNTIRDLLYIETRPAENFPQDLGREGFDNVVEGQSMSPLLLEKYLRAAKDSLDAAIFTEPEPEPKKIEQRYFPLSAAQIGGKEPTKSTPLGLDKYLATKHPEKLKSNLRTLELDATSENPKNHPNPRDRGTVREGKGAHGYEVVLPHDGRNTRQGTISYLNKEPLAPGHYKVVVYAYAEKSLSKEGVLLEPTGACLLGLDVDQVRVAERTVPISDQPQKFEFDIYSPHLRIVVGAATNVNRADLAGIPSLVLCEVDITGPLNEQWPPKSHRALFGPDGKWTLEETLSNFVTRAFRRPALPEEIAKYKAIADEEIKAGATPEVATKVALQSVLISPNFLFLVEESRPDRNLNDFEFASRLSYFLWSSMPDEELFALATKGKLREPKTLKMQLLRMLRDPKAEALVSNFASQWIGFRRLSEIAPDPTVFPTWDEDLRKAMRQESEELFRYVMHENLPVLNFLDSDFTFLNERLAKHYGIPDVTGGDFRKVALKPEYGRGGLLTQAGVLTLASQPTRSSPVFRGKFVLDKLFNRPPAPPPANVAALDEKKAVAPKNLREQLAQHASAANCAGCHVKMDPWGLALEGFDGIGKSRPLTDDEVTGILADGSSVVGVAGLKREMLVRKDDFMRGLLEKMMLYACGRAMTLDDKQSLPAQCDYMKAKDYRFNALIGSVVSSHSFQTR